MKKFVGKNNFGVNDVAIIYGTNQPSKETWLDIISTHNQKERYEKIDKYIEYMNKYSYEQMFIW